MRNAIQPRRVLTPLLPEAFPPQPIPPSAVCRSVGFNLQQGEDITLPSAVCPPPFIPQIIPPPPGTGLPHPFSPQQQRQLAACMADLSAPTQAAHAPGIRPVAWRVPAEPARGQGGGGEGRRGGEGGAEESRGTAQGGGCEAGREIGRGDASTQGSRSRADGGKEMREGTPGC